MVYYYGISIAVEISLQPFSLSVQLWYAFHFDLCFILTILGFIVLFLIGLFLTENGGYRSVPHDSSQSACSAFLGVSLQLTEFLNLNIVHV